MPINIKMKVGFMYLGVTMEDLSIAIPYPTSGTFETNRTATLMESADGTIVGQMIERSRDKQTLSWDVMDCNKWWEINNYLEQNGMFFYLRYFNFNLGVWQTKRYYIEKPSCEAYRPNSNRLAQDYGQPRFLMNCSFSVVDMGGDINEISI